MRLLAALLDDLLVKALEIFRVGPSGVPWSDGPGKGRWERRGGTE